jgi:transcriptional regulator with XRE-family HTH domain
MLTPALIRGARAMLQMSQAELAAKAGLSKTGLANLEIGRADSRGSTLAAIQQVIESLGIEITGGERPGLRWRDWKWSVATVGSDGVRRAQRLCPDFDTTLAVLTSLMAGLKEPDRPFVHVPAEATDEQRSVLKSLGLSNIWP